jgi:serine protease AprX
VLPSHSRLPVEYGYSVPQDRCVYSYTPFATLAGLLILLMLWAQVATAQQRQQPPLPPEIAAKLAPDLAHTLVIFPAETRIAVIVQTDGKPLSALLPPLMDEAAIASPVRTLNSTGLFAATLTVKQLITLSENPAVRHVSPDRLLFCAQDYATQTVGANVAWTADNLSGAGITVAVLDTGIYTHMDLGPGVSRLLAWQDCVNAKTTPYDDNGHGTHVTGIVAGNGAASIQGKYSSTLTWMAPKVNFVSVKVLDSTGCGTASTVITGINWCIAHRQQYNIRVLNLSLGHPVMESYQTDPLCQACESAWKAGILVVCAAGNLGRSIPTDPASPPVYGTITSPGNDPAVLTVGATDTQGTATLNDDTIASYSSRGPTAIDFVLKPDIVAPGNKIDSLAAPNSSLFLGYPTNQVSPSTYHGSGAIQYFELSGTSMASPVVAGAAALMLQADPTLTPDVIKARMMVSALKSATNDPFTSGAGYLNVPAALACRVGAPLGAYSPFTHPASDNAVHITPYSGSTTLLWGENLIWGDNKTAALAVYGTAAWNANSITTNSIWTASITPNATMSAASIEAILLNGD